jgi:ATP-dependent RNA helicase DeaD
VEADAKEPTGVTRGRNAVHLMPLDWSAAGDVLAVVLDRIDQARAETQVLIVTSDAENAAAAAEAIVAAAGDRAITVMAATASPRAARLLKASAAHVVTGAPAELVALTQGSALKSEAIRTVVFAWLDPILETPEAAPLESLLGELPKDGARIVLASELTPAYEALIERYARRARRASEAPADEQAKSLSAEYVSSSPTSRGATLRRLLDALDLPRAELYARTPSVRAEGSTIVRALGYPSDAVRITSGETPSAATNDPLVLLELPKSKEDMRALVGSGARKLYALVQPSQLASLRAVLGGGTVTPMPLVEAAERARGKDAALRASLRDVLTSGDVRREVLALEPLLAEFDGIEIAAAALRMLEQQRGTRPAAATSAQAGPMQRLFVNLGEKDGLRAQEIIVAITTNAGIPGSQVGRVEVRDTHSIVEVSSAVAELVVGKITGATVRGRKVQARLDAPKEDRPPRSSPPRSGPPRSGGDHPARPFERDRGDRPARPSDRGDRPARPFNKTDRPARPGSDRPSRPFTRDAAPRKFDGGTARPTRPRPPRDDA